MRPEFYLPERLSTREASATDRDRIGAFLVEMLSEFNLGLDHYGTDRDIVELPDSYTDGYFGLIEDEDRLLGTFALFKLNDQKAEIRKMYLHPDLRGQGIGKQLLRFVESVAIQKNYRILELQTASAMTAARAMYEKSGFVEIDPDSRTERCDRKYYKQLYGEEN